MATQRTVNDLIKGSLRIVGALAVGEALQSEEAATALEALQDMIAAKAGGLFVPCVVQEAITLVVSHGSYTIGEDGTPDKDTQRPEQIIGAWVRDSGGIDHPVAVIDERNYNAIPSKSTSARPDRIWYNPTSPNGTIYAYPVPNTAESLYISSVKSLAEPSSLTSDLLNNVYIPRSYHGPLKWMLALELCPEYGREPSTVIIQKADQGERHLESLNMARRIKPAVIEIGTSGGKGMPRGTILSY